MKLPTSVVKEASNKEFSASLKDIFTKSSNFEGA